jgi:GNAT superfamily N-acetyltransferase
MLETYHSEWRGSVAGLLQDGFGARFRALIAAVHILDLYVAHRHRARGIAVQLIARAAGVVHSEGGAFIKGGAVESGTAFRLYGRFAPAFGNEYILGGKAFRHLAAQANLPLRELVRSLPKREWNFEP